MQAGAGLRDRLLTMMVFVMYGAQDVKFHATWTLSGGIPETPRKGGWEKSRSPHTHPASVGH